MPPPTTRRSRRTMASRPYARESDDVRTVDGIRRARAQACWLHVEHRGWRMTPRRLGVLGWPVAHSRSPAMHNAALQALGMEDWRYQALPVPRELFAETVRALGQAGFIGANVTIPHKQAALAMADQASDAARAIGAANTLTFAPDGTIAAENTDAPGLIAALEQL